MHVSRQRQKPDCTHCSFAYSVLASFPFGEGTLAALVEMCRERIWPLLKNSTRISYDFFLDTHILPKWGSVKLAKMRTIELLPVIEGKAARHPST